MAVLSVTPSVLTRTDVLTVHVRGPVDPTAVDALRDALLRRPGADAAGPAVLLDLREVTDFPRLAVAVLVSAHRMLGRRLHIRGNPEVLALVEDAGLTDVLRPLG